MATLGNILARKGGTAMTGREVTLTIPVPNAQGGNPTVESALVLLLPVSEARKAAAFRAAEAYVAECERIAAETGQPSTAPSREDERALRFMCEAMHDAEDARKFFVDSDKVNDFRSIVVAEQMRLLLAEYDQLITDEYAEIRSKAELAQMKAQAHETFQPGQG